MLAVTQARRAGRMPRLNGTAQETLQHAAQANGQAAGRQTRAAHREFLSIHLRIYSSRQYTHCLSNTSLPLPLTSLLLSSCSAWLRATERSSPPPLLQHRVPPSLGLLPHTEDLWPRVYVTAFLLRLESCILSSYQPSSIILLQDVPTLIYRSLQSAVTMAAQQKRKQSSLPAGEFLSHVKTICTSTSTIDSFSRVQRGQQQGPHAPLRGELAQASRANT